jgi:class 3 adenylate cyclase
MPEGAVRGLTWAVIPLALLGYGLYVLLGLSGPTVNGPADFTPDDAFWVLGQVVFAVVGAVVASRRPASPIGWLYCAAGLLGIAEGIAARAAVHGLAGAPGSPAGGAAAWLSASLWYPNLALLVLGSLLFPTGRPLSRSWWTVGWLLAVGGVLATIGMLLLWPARGLELLGSSPQSPRAPLGTAIMNAALLILAAAAVSTVAGLLVRLKRSRGVERQQLKWLTYAGALAVAGLLLLLPGEVGFASPSGSLHTAGAVLTAAGALGIPVAVGVAILRYRLFDIDVLIARTVVYGLLSAGFTVIYLAIVVGIGTLVGSGGKPNALLTVAATGVMAVAFQPLRDRSRRLANRLVYGNRATPYEVLSTFSRAMASASGDDSLPRMARLVVEATGAVQATVWLRFGDVLQPQASWPQGAQLPEPVPLHGRGVDQAMKLAQPGSLPFPVGHEEELLGALTVTVSPAEPLNPASEKLITDLAAQTGLGLQFQRMKERALFARALASFLPPEVTELVADSPSALSLREELEATIVFSDIRGFTSLAERLAPRQVAEVIGRHLNAMADVVSSHGGVVDKFAGDAVMAVFGAPRPTDDHARRAMVCAVAMQRRQLSLNQAAKPANLPSSQIGIGINTGTVIAGTLGGRGRLDYTVLGDAVNIAQRLQSQAAGGEILAAAATVLQAGDGQAEAIGPKQLKGRRELVETYRIPWTDVSTMPQPSAGTAHAD